MAGSKKILIVEDDKSIAEMYARLLVKEGYHVDYALNGKDGLTKSRQGEYDLILLDIMMPEVTGIDVLKELRGPDGLGLPQTKIVVLTNLGQNQASQEALMAKADGYLIKADVVPSKLLKIVKTLLDKKVYPDRQTEV
jgi:DNA-binding response OmpR family regulator